MTEELHEALVACWEEMHDLGILHHTNGECLSLPHWPGPRRIAYSAQQETALQAMNRVTGPLLAQCDPDASAYFGQDYITLMLGDWDINIDPR